MPAKATLASVGMPLTVYEYVMVQVAVAPVALSWIVELGVNVCLPVWTSVLATPNVVPLQAPAPVAVSAIVNTPRSAPGVLVQETSMYDVRQEGVSVISGRV